LTISAEPLARPASNPTFLVRREPRLTAALLAPSITRRPLPVPVEGSRTHYLFWARSGIYHSLHLLGLTAGDTVLAPAYHCASLVEPILHSGASVQFFQIRRDCSLDLDDIRARIDRSTRAIIAVHYFGFPQRLRELRTLCDERGVFLIEDCAHVLSGQSEGHALGSVGDVSVFSWRKFLPLYDGGVLAINNPAQAASLRLRDPSPLLRLRIWKNLLDRLVDDSPFGESAAFRGILRSVSKVGRRIVSRSQQPAALAVNNYSLDLEPESLSLGMSGPSRRILRQAKFGDIIEARRRNYRMLEDRLTGVPSVAPLFPALPEGVCPWVFPLVASGRAGFHLELRARGIPAVTWGEVVHRDLPLREFPGARFLYDHAVFLPVHQDLSESDLEITVEAIRAVATGRS
jgi:perosamine synthetase